MLFLGKTLHHCLNFLAIPEPMLHLGKAYLQIVAKDKHSSLLGWSVSDEKKTFYCINTWAQSYKTFYVRNLRTFIIG